MKKLVKILVFVLVLFLMGCGEKKEELTGLHKEFDIIFNGIKEQATSEFNANKEEMEKVAKNSTGSEKEAEAMFNSFEIVLEALKISTYSVENINDMGDKAELKIKVKAVDFVGLSDEVLKNYKAKNNQSEEEVMIESMKELYNTVKSGKAPMKEEEMTVQMVKENRDLLKEFGKKAKEFLGKTMLGHQDFYKYLEDNSLVEKLK